MIHKVYVAGPMTGLPQFNFPAFDGAAACLRADGYAVVTPSELDSDASRAAALASDDGEPGVYAEETGESWGDLLARDVKLIADEGIEAIVVLPGWEQSRGARLETFVGGALCGLPVLAFPTMAVVSADTLNAAWCGLDVPTTGEHVVVNAATGGAKGSKPQQMELLPWGALLAISEVYHHGAKKYAPDNWRKGYDWSLSFGALMRHLALWYEGQDDDPEFGLSHLAHAGFHVLALLTFAAGERYAEMDNRPA